MYGMMTWKESCATALLIALSLVGWAQPDTLIAERVVYYEQPIAILQATDDPDDNRLFIVGHWGTISILEDGELLPEPFLDLSETGLDILNYGNSSEQGVNGMAFDLDYENNGYFYLAYNGVRPDGTGHEIEQRVICFKRDDNDPNKCDPSEWYELLEFDEGDDPETGHNGGEMGFGPDGTLFISSGDGGGTGTGATGGGSGGDDHGDFGNGQNLQTFLGKILRIEPHGMEPYTIPSDNPFVDDPDAFDEIWAYGLRNAWRWSYDRLTWDRWIGDVGEVDFEEFSLELAGSTGGENYGWRLLEGDMCYEPTVDCDPDNTTVRPVHAYPHTDGECANVGGVRYRGTRVPSLYGYFLYADFCGFYDEKFWTLRQTNDGWVRKPVWVEVPGGFVPWQESRFGFSQDNNNEVYILTKQAIYSLHSDPNQAYGDKPELMPYPNPATGTVKVELGVNVVVDGMELFDTAGRVVTGIDFTSVGGIATFDVSGLSGGVYILRASCNNGASVQQTRLMVATHTD